MNKVELMERINEIKSKYEDDGETSHIKIDNLLYEYIGFNEEELKIVQYLCPWHA